MFRSKSFWTKPLLGDRAADALLWVAGALAIALWLWRPLRFGSDIWWHLATGRYMAMHGAVPLTDVFSSTVFGREWINHEWLLQGAWYGFYRLAHVDGLLIFKILLVVSALAIQGWRMRRWGVPTPLQWVFLALVFWASRFGWNERADLASIWFLSLLSLWLDELSRDPTLRKRLWVWPALFCLWANSHGGFVLGLAVAAIYTAGVYIESRPRDPLWAAGWALGAAGTLLNPHGLRLHASTLEALGLLRQGFLTEWQRTPWVPLQLFWGCLIAFGVIFLSRVVVLRRQSVPQTLVGLFLAWSAVQTVRNVPYFMVAAFPYLALWISRDLAAWKTPRHVGPIIRHWRLLALTATLVFGANALPAVQGGVSRAFFPVAACDFIEKTRITATFYNDYVFGGYWIWRLAPRRPVFIDGRFHTVDGYAALYRDLQAAQGGDPGGWGRFLDRHQVDAALVGYPAGAPFDSVFALYFPRERWALVYWDDVAAVYLRRTRARARFIRHWEFPTVHPDSRPEAFIQAAQRSPRAAARLRSDVERNLRLHPDSRRAEMFRRLLNTVSPSSEGRKDRTRFRHSQKT